MKLFKVLLLSLLLCSIFACTINGENDEYIVYDNSSGFSQEFLNYDEAHKFYQKNIDNYQNLILKQNDKVIEMEYGFVIFDSNDYENYYSITKGVNDYVLGSYSIDAAYLYTLDNKVYFVLSDDYGYIDLNIVKLIPYEELKVKPSLYLVKDNELYHNIKTQIDYEFYTYSNIIDKAPSYLENNKEYYSYDGHYFYNDFYSMIDDYRNDTYDNSLCLEPYYNYYQFLQARSLTNYTSDNIKQYLYDELGINSRLLDYYDLNGDNAADIINQSQLYGQVDTFFNCEAIYGDNALLLLSSAIYESSYGRSKESYLENNLFTNYAFDSIAEKQNNRYNSIENSIIAHSKAFIARLYSNYLRNDYQGTFLGDKSCGINVNYSIDPYYGEKIASTYYKIDKALGFKDYNSNAIGVVDSKKSIEFYEDYNLQSFEYEIKDINKLSLVILQELDNSYKVQTDYWLEDNYQYDYEDAALYVEKDVFDYVFNIDSIKENEYEVESLDFDGGLYCGLDSMEIKLRKNRSLNIIPHKDGYEFIGYDNSNKAQYKKIDSISIGYLLEKQSECVPYPNISNAYINVKYEDATSKKIFINSDNISLYNLVSDQPQDVYITYNGVSSSKSIQIDYAYYQTYSDINKAIKDEDYSYIKDNIYGIDYPFDISTIRQIDAYLKQEDNRNYVISDTPYREKISISGLDLSLDDRDSFIYINDTYYVSATPISNEDKKLIMDVAKGYGFEAVDGFDVSFSFNYQDIKLNGPVVMKLNVDNKEKDKVYSVYHLDDNNNVIKCRTIHSNNAVSFIANDDGAYLVLSLPSVNVFDIEDETENLSYENMGIDNNRINLELLIIIALILFSFIGITFYYIYFRKKENQWKDYKKSLQ